MKRQHMQRRKQQGSTTEYRGELQCSSFLTMVIEAEQPPRNFEAHCMSARLEKEISTAPPKIMFVLNFCYKFCLLCFDYIKYTGR